MVADLPPDLCCAWCVHGVWYQSKIKKQHYHYNASLTREYIYSHRVCLNSTLILLAYECQLFFVKCRVHVNDTVTLTMGQKSACGLRSNRSWVCPKNSNLIENKVSIWTANLSKCNCFSPFFLRCRSVIINAVRRQRRRGKNQPVGWDLTDHGFAPKTAI